jgi:hypothetical protein
LSTMGSKWISASHAWFNQLVAGEHMMIWNNKDLHRDNVWYLGVEAFDDSAVFAWPGTLEDIPGSKGTAKVWQPDMSITAPQFTSLLDLSDRTQSYVLEWRSWAWQKKHFPSVRSRWRPALRRVVKRGPGKVLVNASWEAFWNMSESTIRKLVEHAGYVIPQSDGSLCRTLFFVIKEILKCTDQQAIEILLTRIASHDKDASYVHELLTLDEALEVVDPRDCKEIRREQEAEQNQQTLRDQFLRDFRVRVRQVSGVVPARAGRAAAKAHAKAMAARPVVPRNLTSATANTWKPPQAFIWKSLTHYSWCGHVPPRPRISEMWGTDVEGALGRLLKRCWALHLEIKGVGWDECPYNFAA